MKDKSSLRDIVNFIKETIKDCKTGKYVIDRETDTALEIVCEEQAYIIKIDNETSINNIKEADELINKLKDILEDEGYTVDKSDLVDSSDYLIIYIWGGGYES